ncbi:MAG: 50S ribosomal protein L11 methyltransferase [Bradyrhizobiaceae bacterium]|nr:50S ribosomal protein L11 methyltransferase [Bradyrhizobiaceae bacterium]
MNLTTSPLAGQATHVMRFATSEREARRISDLLFEQLDPSQAAVSTFEGEKGWLVEVHFASAPDQACMTALVREASGGETPEIAFERVAVTDWVAASLAGLRPVQVGRFVIHGAHDRARVRPNQIGIEIEAALAFGTGHHGTTQGCLAAIDRASRIKRPRRVLDLGSGTGVLAIAAARTFRRLVVAGEIDPWAVLATRVNARANRAGACVRAVHADGVRHPQVRAGAPYDFVLANILLAPLKRLARPVRALLAPGATVVLSGLNPEHANAAIAAWCGQGLVLRRQRRIDNWVTLTFVRP